MNMYLYTKDVKKKLKVLIKIKMQSLHSTFYKVLFFLFFIFFRKQGFFFFLYFLVWAGFWFCCCCFNFSFFFVLKTKRLLGLLITCISRHWHSHYIWQPQFWMEKVPCKRMHGLGRRREVNRIVP